MVHLNLDEDGYLLSASYTPTGGPWVASLAGFDLAGHRLRAHRWDGTALVLDETRLAELDAAAQADEAAASVAALRQDLETTTAEVVEALEGLLTATTATELLTALLTARDKLGSTLTARADIRAKIKSIEEANSDGL